jgi:uncharacterized protein YecE (DUF72 family)
MLEYYSARLRGVELNGSFYRMPPATALDKWAAGTPAGFKFCLKASRGLTYSAEGFDRVGLARLFAERMSPLGEKRGPVLLQFPPVRQRNVALLDALLEALGGGVAAEFRHDSWFHPETYEVIRRHAGALVVTDEEKWPQAPLVDLGPIAYFRLRRGYKPAALEPWMALIRSAVASHGEVHVYFKHDPQAPRLALRVQGDLGREAGSGSLPRRSRTSAATRAEPAGARTPPTDPSGSS